MKEKKTIQEVTIYLKEHNVECRAVIEGSPEEFIAVFSYGDLTKSEIVKATKENGIQCMMFGTIMEKSRRKRG